MFGWHASWRTWMVALRWCFNDHGLNVQGQSQHISKGEVHAPRDHL